MMADRLPKNVDGTTVTNFANGPLSEEKPEADVAEQRLSVEASDDSTLDVEYIDDRSDSEADSADLYEQAIDVPLPDDEHTTGA
jgi:hypothetical protein